MKKVFELSKENLDLSKQEVLALAGTNNCTLIENFLIVDAKFKFSRLAYTKIVYDLLFIAKRNNFDNSINKFNWQKAYKKSFCVRVINDDKNKEKKLADLIWEKLHEPKVNLKNPATTFAFFFTENEIIALKLTNKIDQSSFEKRRAHLRPAMHPSSLHPRLARALVNLTGIQKGTILDPFVGSGGILIEAGLMGLKVEGMDIEQSMLNMAEENLTKLKIKHKLQLKDATTIKSKLNYVIADLPYAKATKSQDLDVLYSKFFKVLKQNLQKKAVIGLPDFTNNEKLLKDAELKIENEFTIYVHKSLSKKIFVIVK